MLAYPQSLHLEPLRARICLLVHGLIDSRRMLASVLRPPRNTPLAKRGILPASCAVIQPQKQSLKRTQTRRAGVCAKRKSLKAFRSVGVGRRVGVSSEAQLVAGRAEKAQVAERRGGALCSKAHAPAIQRLARQCLGDVVGKSDLGHDIGSVVGCVTETDAQHRRRHHPFKKNCARCIYLALRSNFESGYGSYKHELGDKRARTVWLASRPTKWQGVWGLGCIFCACRAQALMHGDDRPSKRRRSYGNTKWARYEIRSLTQIASRGIRQHAETMQHRVAVREYFKPDPG